MAEATSDDDADAMAELNERLNLLSREQGIDAMLKKHDLDAIIAVTMPPASMIDPANGEKFMGASSNLAAIAGYPMITVPAGYAHGLPVGFSIIGTAWSEATLLSIAYAWEQATQMYRPPMFATTDIARDTTMPQLELPPVMSTPDATPQGTPGATPVT